ncbi:MAG: DUF2878 family protein [Desulfobacterales bacterium]|nr:DUF2878 family protein [Desulfobacterales bacterium]
MNDEQNFFSLRTIVQMALFQAAWLLSILGASHGLVLLGPAFVAILILVRMKTSKRPACDVCFYAARGAVGFLIDSSFIATGIFTPVVFFFPSLLWDSHGTSSLDQFRLLMDTAFSWFRNRPLFQALLGAFGGPAAHIGAMFLGAVTLGKPIITSLLILTVVWAAVIPLLFSQCSNRSTDGTSPAEGVDCMRFWLMKSEPSVFSFPTTTRRHLPARRPPGTA